MKKLFLFLLIYLFIQGLLGFASKAYATDFYDWYFGSNDHSNIVYQVGFRVYYGCPQGVLNTSNCVGNNGGSRGPAWFILANASGCSGFNRCNSGENPLNGQTDYIVQWGTSCHDPSVKLVPFTDPGGGIGNRYYSAGAVDITNVNSAHDAGLQNFFSAGGGTIFFGSAFDDQSQCPTAPVNQCSAGTHQCSGNTSQECQSVGGVNQWVNTACTSACDNSTGQCRFRTCQGNACNWVAGNNSDGCTSSANCTTGGTFCTPNSRQCIGGCQYQVCNSGGTAWGATQACGANSGCVTVGGSTGASCQSSAASQCTTNTCQQCSGSTCTTFTQTGACSTNCNACPSGGSC